MRLPDVVQAIAEAFDALGIEYMIAGSVASSAWGEVRSTQDLDVVVVATRTDLVRLFYQARLSARHARKPSV